MLGILLRVAVHSVYELTSCLLAQSFNSSLNLTANSLPAACLDSANATIPRPQIFYIDTLEIKIPFGETAIFASSCYI